MIIHSYTLDTQDKVKAQYGGTTWVQITNRFLYGSNNAGTNGGSNDAIVVSHTHTFRGTSKNYTSGVESATHTHEGTTSENGNHNHNVLVHPDMHPASGGTDPYTFAIRFPSQNSITPVIENGSHKHTIYTAGELATHTHTTNITPEGANDSTGSSGTNANMPAYTTCYIWRRTA